MNKEIKELIEIGIELKEKSSNEEFVVGRIAGQVAIIHKDKYETMSLATLTDSNLFERIKTDKEKELENKLEITNSIIKIFIEKIRDYDYKLEKTVLKSYDIIEPEDYHKYDLENCLTTSDGDYLDESTYREETRYWILEYVPEEWEDIQELHINKYFEGYFSLELTKEQYDYIKELKENE